MKSVSGVVYVTEDVGQDSRLHNNALVSPWVVVIGNAASLLYNMATLVVRVTSVYARLSDYGTAFHSVAGRFRLDPNESRTPSAQMKDMTSCNSLLLVTNRCCYVPASQPVNLDGKTYFL